MLQSVKVLPKHLPFPPILAILVVWEEKFNFCYFHIISLFKLFIMKQVLIHFKPSYRSVLDSREISYREVDNELDVILPDVDTSADIYNDPDELFCEHYDLDYDQVNCIEAV